MNNNSIIECADKNILNTYARFPLVIERGEGTRVYDDQGKEYLDLTSGIGVNSIGYGNKKLLEALQSQMNNLLHISNLFYNIPSTKLAERLIKLSGMAGVFWANSGAEANEGAIKVARKYSEDKYGKGRANIITLKNSFHGRTLTTLAATGQDKFHDKFTPLTTGFLYSERNNIEDFLAKADNSVCAVMMEAIQGEGGVNCLTKEYVQKVKEIALKKDILIIFDEVQCGMGRTGHVFGYEEFGISPDIVTLAKGLGAGLPIGAFLCSDKLFKVLGAGDHGSTFGGNLLSATAGLVVMDYMENCDFISEIQKKGEYFKAKLIQIASGKIVEVRGKGLMIGIELNCDAKPIIEEGIELGLLTLSAGPKVIRLLPPLVITYDEIDRAVHILKKLLN